MYDIGDILNFLLCCYAVLYMLFQSGRVLIVYSHLHSSIRQSASGSSL